MGIRVLVVDDSSIARELLFQLLSSDTEIEVVGSAANGKDALQQAKTLKPDLITMDIHMPVMNGFEATKEIMIECPTPIVIVSASTAVSETKWAMQSLEAGALTLKLKPPGVNAPEFDAIAADLIETVKALSDVKVVKHHRRRYADDSDLATLDDRIAATETPASRDSIRQGMATRSRSSESVRSSEAARLGGSTRRPRSDGGKRSEKFRLVAVAASTGGPPALHELLGQLPADFPLPILLVQHIADGFVAGFASWLDSVIALTVKLAEDGEVLLPGVVYVAPQEMHLGVTRGLRVALSDAPAKDGFRPSANHLFATCGEAIGAGTVGIVLTGMGRDGADGMYSLHQKGARTIVQDEGTCVVYGMPRAVVLADAADDVLPLQEIAPHLLNVVSSSE